MEDRIIIFPTDTVYGIGCSVYDSKSIDRIYKIKKRPKNKPLAILCGNLEQIEEIAYLDGYARLLISKYMPGPLTLIVESKDEIYESIGLERIGVRIPNSKIALEILNKMGPLATTSVNESGEIPINEYEEIVKQYSKKVDKIYPTNEVSSNISSTVVLIDGDDVRLIREGEIPFEEIKNLKIKV